MIKAKEFLDYLCNDLNYRFFSGVPTLGLKGIFSAMNSGFMHYIPAANEDIAIKLSTGIRFSGKNAAVLLDAEKLNDLSLNFNVNAEVPILVLASFSERPKHIDWHIRSVFLSDSYRKDLDSLVDYINSSSAPAVLFFEEGEII